MVSLTIQLIYPEGRILLFQYRRIYIRCQEHAPSCIFIPTDREASSSEFVTIGVCVRRHTSHLLDWKAPAGNNNLRAHGRGN